MISDKFRTVFVHVPKTGGQSVELAFLRAQGLTWNRRESLLLRLTDDRKNGPKRLAHLYASEYVGLGHMTAEDFAGYFKFAVVRDPYERLMSEYRYRADWQAMSIDRFLGTTFDSDWTDAARHLVPQVRYVRDEAGQVMVDRIIKFESMAQDMPPLLSQLIGAPQGLPHRNRSKGGHGRVSDLTRDQLRRITQRYEVDFEAFGYPTRD